MNITIISPKPEFPGLAQFKRVDASKISLSLAPQQGKKLADFVFEFIPILGSICGLIYGIEILTEAAEIALQWLERYIKATGKQTELCLKDIAEALRSVIAKGFRKGGYKDAAETGLELLIGKQNLFACRKGLPLEWLFGMNVILHAHSLTNPMQCQMLLLFLLYWFYRGAKLGGNDNRIKHVMIIDDASRFLSPIRSQFERQSITSPLGHILAVLREAGIAVIFVTQLPDQIDPAVLSLIRTVLVIGNITGDENLRVIKNCMSLEEIQKSNIIGFKRRESLLFCSGHKWAKPIHGWTPTIGYLPKINSSNNDYIDMIEPWSPLKDIPQPQQTSRTETAPVPQPTQTENTVWKRLVFDCTNYPFDKVSDRIPRLDISGREYEAAKNWAMQNGYLLESKAGKTLYLIPTKKTFEEFSQPCPYERAASVEHSFYVLLAAHILRQAPNTASVKTEVPIGSKGATIDVVSTDKSGEMTALEITLSLSNLMENAAKLQDTAYATIIWLCRDAATAKAVKAYFNKSSSLPSELLSKFEYIHFSKFEKQE